MTNNKHELHSHPFQFYADKLVEIHGFEKGTEYEGGSRNDYVSKRFYIRRHKDDPSMADYLFIYVDDSFVRAGFNSMYGDENPQFNSVEKIEFGEKFPREKILEIILDDPYKFAETKIYELDE